MTPTDKAMLAIVEKDRYFVKYEPEENLHVPEIDPAFSKNGLFTTSLMFLLKYLSMPYIHFTHTDLTERRKWEQAITTKFGAPMSNFFQNNSFRWGSYSRTYYALQDIALACQERGWNQLHDVFQALTSKAKDKTFRSDTNEGRYKRIKEFKREVVAALQSLRTAQLQGT